MNVSTAIIVKTLEILAREIESGDGVANAALYEAAERMRQLAPVWTLDLPDYDGWYWVRQIGRPSTRRIQWIAGGSDWTGYEFAGPIPLPEEPS